MRIIAASITALYLVLGTTVSLWAGESTLSPQAQELKSLLTSLKERPHDKSIQMQYLEKFPKDIGAFRYLFDQSDFSELYLDSEEYISSLYGIEQDQPDTVGKILVGLSKDAPQGADALSSLQGVTAQYAVKHTATFAKLLHSHTESDRSNLIKYLADVENYNFYPEYQHIITNLRKIGETNLAQQFEAARSKRMKQKGHGELRDEPSMPGGV